MATIKDISVIYDEMQLKGLNMYVVKDSDNKTTLTSLTDKDVTPSQAVKLLTEFLAKLDGIVYIQIRNKTSQEVGAGGDIKNQIYTYCVKLGDAIAPATAVNNTETSANYIGAIAKAEENFNIRLNALRTEMQKDAEIAELKKQLDEAKTGDNMQNKGLEILAQLLASNINASGSGINGFKEQKKDQNFSTGIGAVEPDKLTRLKAAIKKISSVDKDYLTHLELLANIAINKPMVYSQAITKLKEF